jgi:hypothetical protein
MIMLISVKRKKIGVRGIKRKKDRSYGIPKSILLALNYKLREYIFGSIEFNISQQSALMTPSLQFITLNLE